MPPSISPTTIGFSSYTVSGSGNAWFYLDIELATIGDSAEFEVQCPSTATLTLTEETAAPIILSTTGTITNTSGNRTVESIAAPGVVNITITANNTFHTHWVLRVGAIAPTQSVTFQVTTASAQIDRVLADPVVSAPALAPIKEKTPIGLTGTANYTTTTATAGTQGIPDPPMLRAQWSQTAHAEISAPPPTTLFSATIATVPLNATIAPSPAFRAPGVYTDQQLGYSLKAFYDDNPNMNADPGEPTASADVTLTVQPRTQHMLLLVDRSGSMLAPMPGTPLTRWEFARQAAHVWADLWIALRRDVSASDQAGIMIFEAATCGWTGTAASPIEILLPASGKLGGVTDLDVPSLDLGTPGACTPIGDALIAAIDDFVTAGGSIDDRYVILLLTDGYENSGAVVVEDDSPTPAGATATFDSQRGAGPRAAVSSLLAIYTAGLGSPGTVQESALQDLTDSPTDRGLYRLVQADQLMHTFGEMLGDALEAQSITPANPNGTFPVSANENRLVIALRWKTAADRMRVFRKFGGGTEEQVVGTGKIATGGITEFQRANHGIVVVDLKAHFSGPVPASTWRVEYWENDTTQTPIAGRDLLVMVDLFVKADVRFDRTQYVTGQRALLTCQLSAGGQPITGARVDVELARPGQGLGTFLASNGATYKPSGQGGLDPLAPKAAMLVEVLRRKDLRELPLDHPTGIFRDGSDQLWDDGMHIDGVADNGTYANTYTGLDKEGTYDWRLAISGTTPDGNPFTRVVTRAFWVGVRVDPASSKVEIRPQESHTENQRAAQITVTPVDARGELLGPFRAAEVDIRSKFGQFLTITTPPSDGIVYPKPDKGDLVSYYDGRYSRVLTYQAGEKPVVTITIQGQRFPDVVIS